MWLCKRLTQLFMCWYKIITNLHHQGGKKALFRTDYITCYSCEKEGELCICFLYIEIEYLWKVIGKRKKAWGSFHSLSFYAFKIFSYVTLLAIQKLNKVEKIKLPWLAIDIKT